MRDLEAAGTRLFQDLGLGPAAARALVRARPLSLLDGAAGAADELAAALAPHVTSRSVLRVRSAALRTASGDPRQYWELHVSQLSCLARLSLLTKSLAVSVACALVFEVQRLLLPAACASIRCRAPEQSADASRPMDAARRGFCKQPAGSLNAWHVPSALSPRRACSARARCCWWMLRRGRAPSWPAWWERAWPAGTWSGCCWAAPRCC